MFMAKKQMQCIICMYFLDAGISKTHRVGQQKAQKTQLNHKMNDKSFSSQINLIKKRTITDPSTGTYICV